MAGRVESRYEITHPEHGLIDTEPTYADALLRAHSILKRPSWEDETFVHIYDVMARVGMWQLVKVTREIHGGVLVTQVERRTKND